MWTKSENCEPVKPPEVSADGNGVIVRRKFKSINATEDFPAHWEWEEWQMTRDQYDFYVAMSAANADLEDALIELADMIVGG